MSNLIKNEFSGIENEELIEEFISEGNIKTAGKDKYQDESYSLNKQSGLIPAETENDNNFLTLSPEGDLVFKPSILNMENGENGSVPKRTEIITYVVQNGETISNIARRFGVSVNTVLWENNLGAYSLIRPGDNLRILPFTGITHTVKSGDTVSAIARKYGVSEESITSANNSSGSLKIGQKLLIPGGVKIAAQVASTQNRNVSGLSVIKDLVTPSSSKASPSNSMLVWPTVGHRITQYFSWRHNGVDIGNKVGTPIYAADDGVVTVSAGGWNGGYGNAILINHGGNVKTRYGHASKLLVKVGETVERGQLIALMGSTGRSTGPHLHFEVLIKGTRYNPLNYMK